MSILSRENRYQVTIEDITHSLTGDQNNKQLTFEVQDREDIFKIVDALKQNSGLEADTATQVGVALRLLGPVMMKNRKHALFVDFMPHFKHFMTNLKSIVKKAGSAS